MNGEIICVGTELLLGNIVNTNAQYLGQGLAELGINIYHQSVVGDNPARLKATLKEAMDRSDVVILTGGLGPTADDITKEIIGELVGAELQVREDVLQKLELYYARQGRIMPKGVEKQAMIPEGAEMFHNDVGTAPGFAIEKGGCRIITIPGPPREMKAMFDGYVKPYLKGVSGRSILSNDLHIYGMGESEVETLLGELLEGSNPTAATYAKLGEVTVRVTASAETENEAKFLKEELTRKIADRLGSVLYLVGEGDLSLAAVETLKAKGLKVATAESCTAGMVSKSLTDISGSSAVFEMGVSAYANNIKRKVLGVPQTVLDIYGAVSAETAAIMAKGVKNISSSDIGIGITGVAGPEPSEGKPVGLVYVGMTDGEMVWIRELSAAFGNDREKVRAYATLAALDMIRRYAVAYPRILGGGAAAGEDIKIIRAADDFVLPEGTAVMGLTPLAEILQLENEVKNAERKEPTVAPTPDEMENMNGMDMIGFVHDPDAHIGYEDIATNSEDFITEYDFDISEEKAPIAKKPALPIRVLKYLLPWKGDRVGEIIRKIIFMVALIVFLTTGIYLINYMGQGSVNENLVDEAREIHTTTEEGVDDKGMLLKYSELYKQNPDIIGWINIEGTKVDYPVYQTEDNDYYVTHDMSRNESRYGAIFADFNAQISPDGNSKNVVLYGHNMIDDSMFGSLLEYNNLEYYREHPVIDFGTIYGEGEYKIFAVLITNANKEQDEGKVFNYRRNAFSSDNGFLYWVENVKARSIINTDVDVIVEDEILTLSTCSYEFEEARTVIIARKIREGESRRVNTAAAKKNPEPLLPQAYYDKHGGKKPKIDIEYQSSAGLESAVTRVEAFNADGEKVEITEEELEAGQDNAPIEFIEVDNYVGLSLTAAIYKINEAGLHISGVKYLSTDENLNTVMRQSVKKGSEVAKGSSIELSVSGSEEEITVPNFIGLTLKEAEELANESGTTLRLVRCASAEKKDAVIMQSVAPETLTKDRYLVLYVSNGRNKVPDVKGLSEKDAKEKLEQAGFKAKVKKKGTPDPDQIGKVISQDVDGGAYQDMDEKVTIYVGKKMKNHADTESEKEDTSSKTISSKNTSSKAETSKDSSTESTSSRKGTSSLTSSASTSSVAQTTTETSSTASSGTSTSSKDIDTESSATSSVAASSEAGAESEASSETESNERVASLSQ